MLSWPQSTISNVKSQTRNFSPVGGRGWNGGTQAKWYPRYIPCSIRNKQDCPSSKWCNADLRMMKRTITKQRIRPPTLSKQNYNVGQLVPIDGLHYWMLKRVHITLHLSYITSWPIIPISNVQRRHFVKQVMMEVAVIALFFIGKKTVNVF